MALQCSCNGVAMVFFEIVTKKLCLGDCGLVIILYLCRMVIGEL